MADTRTYIKVHDGMPDHPKIDVLSDKAFRMLVQTWCWCSRHLTDGHMPKAIWEKRGTPKVRRELLAAGLVAVLPSGDVAVHDYLEHQRSAEKVKEVRQTKGRDGSYGNHVRWHVDRGIVATDCEHCPAPPEDEPDPEPIADASHMRSERRSHIDRKSSPVSVSEERMGSAIPDGGTSDHQSADRYVRDDDDQDSVLEAIATAIRETTGRDPSRDHLVKVRKQLLAGRTVANPVGYVDKSIRDDPERFRPPNTAPYERTVAEAIAAARGDS